MADWERRQILQLTVAGLLSACTQEGVRKPQADEKRKRHVAIIGGGYGGATAARYLKRFDPETHVTLIEYNKIYATAPGSNQVLAGSRNFPSLLVKYRKLEKLGIKVIHDWVSAIDTEGKNLRFDDGSRLGYDRLIVASGIGFNTKSIEGYDDTEGLPHAWLAGVETLILSKQLKSMRSGGIFIVSRPEGVMGCPQAVYERVSLVAEFLQQRNRRAKILLFDPEEKNPLRDHFIGGWRSDYGFGTDQSMIELIAGRDARLLKLDAPARTIYTGAIEQRHKADVLNIIPPQQAGEIAQAAGLTDNSGWCPVHPLTAESSLIPGIHVIGDAAGLQPIDKLASVAAVSAKLCAYAITQAAPEQQQPRSLTMVASSYSRLATDKAFSTVSRYVIDENSVNTTGRERNNRISAKATKEEAAFADSWWKNIKADAWG